MLDGGDATAIVSVRRNRSDRTPMTRRMPLSNVAQGSRRGNATVSHTSRSLWWLADPKKKKSSSTSTSTSTSTPSSHRGDISGTTALSGGGKKHQPLSNSNSLDDSNSSNSNSNSKTKTKMKESKQAGAKASSHSTSSLWKNNQRWNTKMWLTGLAYLKQRGLFDINDYLDWEFVRSERPLCFPPSSSSSSSSSSSFLSDKSMNKNENKNETSTASSSANENKASIAAHRRKLHIRDRYLDLATTMLRRGNPNSSDTLPGSFKGFNETSNRAVRDAAGGRSLLLADPSVNQGTAERGRERGRGRGRRRDMDDIEFGPLDHGETLYQCGITVCPKNTGTTRNSPSTTRYTVQ
jgi:hypothetical protein